MFAEHSIAETTLRLTCLADSSVNFSVQGAITGYGAPRIFETFYVGKWFVVNSDGVGVWWSTSVFPRLIVRPKSLDASEKRASIRCRSSYALAINAQSSAENLLEESLQALRLYCESMQVEEGAVQVVTNVDPLLQILDSVA